MFQEFTNTEVGWSMTWVRHANEKHKAPKNTASYEYAENK